jgi:hypothetical protein
MHLKPFNESRLWQGKIQKEWGGQKPVQRPPMRCLPTPHTYQCARKIGKTIWEEVNQSFYEKSAEYWAGVKQRQDEYRRLHSIPAKVPGEYVAHVL